MAYTTIDDGSKYFQSVLWTGNNAADERTITFDGNSDMQPDWVWHKQRDDVYGHHLFDSSRGFGANKELYSRGTFVEGDTSNFNTGGFGYVNAAASDGFVVKKGSDTNGNRYVNESGDDHVAWCWKANGGTTTSQTGSDIDSVTQANTTSKFSIITYTGASNADSDSDNNSGAYWRVKHGLGSTPKLAIFKKRSSAAAWYVWHHKLGGTQDQKYLQLQGTNAVGTESDILFGNTDWSSTEFEIGAWDVVNRDGTTYVAYMFDEVQGYSKFGKYKGNGNADGPFVYTGFKPAFLIAKETGATRNWTMADSQSQTNGNGGVTNSFQPNTNSAKDANERMDWLSNGFKLRTTSTTWNTSGGDYIYWAFAEHPFVSSKGVPTTAR